MKFFEEFKRSFELESSFGSMILDCRLNLVYMLVFFNKILVLKVNRIF